MKRQYSRFLSLFLPFIASSCCCQYSSCEWQESQGDYNLNSSSCCCDENVMFTSPCKTSTPWSFSPRSSASRQIVYCDQNPILAEETLPSDAPISQSTDDERDVLKEYTSTQDRIGESISDHEEAEKSISHQEEIIEPNPSQEVIEESTTEQQQEVIEEPTKNQEIIEESTSASQQQQQQVTEPAADQKVSEEPTPATDTLNSPKEEKPTEPDFSFDLKENPAKYLHFIATLNDDNFLVLIVKNKGSISLQEITVKVSTPSLPHLSKESTVIKFDGSIHEGADLTALTKIGPFTNFDELKDSLQVNFVGASPTPL